MVLGLLGTVVSARHLSAEVFGGFILLQVIASFLTQVSSTGLGVSTAKFIASTQNERYQRQLVNTAIGFRLLAVLVVSLVTVIAMPVFWTAFGSPVIPSVAVFLPLLFYLESLGSLLRSVLQGFFLFKRIAMTEFIASLSNFLLVAVFVLLLDRGVLGLIYARAISLSLSCAIAYFSTPTRKRFEFHLGLLKEMLAFGLPLQINDILSFVFGRIDTLVIGTLLGRADIAYYEIARRIPDALARLYEAFRSVFFPEMSRLFAVGEHKKAEQVLNHSTRLISFVSTLGALVALILGNDVIGLLFSAKYVPSVPAFILLMTALSISLIGNTLGTSLVAIGDSSKPAIINIVHTGVSLLGNLFLIPILGIVGSALSSLAGSCATNPLNVLFLRRRNVDVRVGDYLKPILVFGLYVLLVLLLKPTTVLQKALVISTFILLCACLSVITGEDLAVILGKSRSRTPKSVRDPCSGSPRL